MTYLPLLPHMPALFMTSQTQIAGHTMAALTLTFLRLSNVDSQKARRETECKAVVCFSFNKKKKREKKRGVFLSIKPMVLLHFVTRHDRLSRTAIRGTLGRGRRRGGQRKCWMDSITEWTSLSIMPELLTMASHRKQPEEDLY